MDGCPPEIPVVAAETETGAIALDSLLKQAPEQLLGPETNRRYDGRLPYLFKVLASGSPLSIQAHPNLEQAAEGFRRENEAGIPIDAYNRNYRDANHKPEIICALSEFYAMRGFRSPSEILENFRSIRSAALEEPLTEIENALSGNADPDEGGEEEWSLLKNFFTALMTVEGAEKDRMIEAALQQPYRREILRWVKRFAELYPGDTGVLSPLYLNIVRLSPGDAMYLPAGELHAYLQGLGIELMANSDNVLRGGLTPKHIDVPELLSVLNFKSGRPEILKPVQKGSKESFYITEAPEFCLSRVELDRTEWCIDCMKMRTGPDGDSPASFPSIFLCISGGAEVKNRQGETFKLRRGGSFFASHGSRLTISGTAVFYRASVNGRFA